MEDRTPYSVELWLDPTRAGSTVFDLGLLAHERKGGAAHGEATLDFTQDPHRSFLSGFLRGEPVSHARGIAFGRELARRLFGAAGIAEEWQQINARRGTRPLRLEVSLPAGASVGIDDLPFELLADEGDRGFWFRRPGWSLVRSFKGQSATSYRLPKQARALLAWANPGVEQEDGSRAPLPSEIFDAHEREFEREVRALSLDHRAPVKRATKDRLGAALRETPETPLLALVAHGAASGGAVLLHADEHGDEGVEVHARDLAAVCKHGGVKVAMLWTCQGARRHPVRSSVASALLDDQHGDVAAVIASHAALVADRTARFVGPLLRSLRDVAEGDLERAMTEARHALDEDDLQWAAPVYYARALEGRSVTIEECVEQVLAAPVEPSEGLVVEGAPTPRSWFRGRVDDIRRAVARLRAHRLVTFTGIPGIGKTALAVAVSRDVIGDAAFGLTRGRWIDLSTKGSAAVLREELAIAFGHDPTKCQTDLALATAMGSTRALLVLDNAEDLLRADGDAFRALLDTLLRAPSALRVLVTSRRRLGDLDGVEEHAFPVGHLPKGVDREVFVDIAGERLTAEHACGEDIDALVDALEGHPQSIVLIAGQVGRGLSLRELRERVEAEDPEVVRAAELFDEDIDESGDANLRTRRLVSSLNLSFAPLLREAPRAAEMFAWLGTFPAGLPETLMKAVFGDDAKRSTTRLLALNMVERGGPDDRLTLPGPVRWYAKRLRESVIGSERRGQLLERSARALASWLRALHAKLGRPGAATACARAVVEGQNLVALAIESGTARSVDASRAVASGFWSYGPLAIQGAEHLAALEVGTALRRSLDVVGDPSSIAPLAATLGALYLRTDRLSEAERAYGEALPLYRSIENRMGEATTLIAQGDLRFPRFGGQFLYATWRPRCRRNSNSTGLR